MLELNVERLVRMHGAERGQVLLMKRGLSAREARTVWHPKGIRQVRDSLLQRLCEGLLCTPNDVFVWRGGAESFLKGLNKGPVQSIADRLGREQDPKEVSHRRAEEMSVPARAVPSRCSRAAVASSTEPPSQSTCVATRRLRTP